MRGHIYILILFLVLVFPIVSFASTYTLEVVPKVPQALEEFQLKLRGDIFDRSSVQWFVNGTEKTEFENENSLTLTAPVMGENMTINARVTKTDRSITNIKHIITPVRVDLLINGNTVVPAFYKGRKLPSSGSEVTATALVFTKENRPHSDYTYIWKINNKTIGGGAVVGKNTITFVPEFETDALVSVEVLTKSGELIASKTQLIPIASPEVHFYEQNPLRGLSSIALGDPFIFVGDEVTIRAEGYFMTPELLSTVALREWKIDGATTASDSESEEEITLKKNGGGGTSVLSYQIRNLKQLLQGAKKSITIRF